MAGTPYLIDSNILIRWVQPSDPDYPILESALEVLAKQRAVLCYTNWAILGCAGADRPSRVLPIKIGFTMSRTGETGVPWCPFRGKKDIPVQSMNNLEGKKRP